MINPALDKYFPADCGVKIIAEPGRFYVASAYTLVINIIAKKVIMDEELASDGKSLDLEKLGIILKIFILNTGLSLVILSSKMDDLCFCHRGRRRDQ